MQAADGGTHKERHPLELSEIELRSGGESIGCRIEGHGDRYARRHQACQLLLKRRGQVLRANITVPREDAVVNAKGQPAIYINAELRNESALRQVQLGRIQIGKPRKRIVSGNVFLLRESR